MNSLPCYSFGHQIHSFSAFSPSTFQRLFMFVLLYGRNREQDVYFISPQMGILLLFLQGNLNKETLGFLFCFVFYFCSNRSLKQFTNLFCEFYKPHSKGSMKIEKSGSSYTCPYPSFQHQDRQRSPRSGVSCISQASLAWEDQHLIASLWSP